MVLTLDFSIPGAEKTYIPKQSPESVNVLHKNNKGFNVNGHLMQIAEN
jgi:hypothetical protein